MTLETWLWIRLLFFSLSQFVIQSVFMKIQNHWSSLDPLLTNTGRFLSSFLRCYRLYPRLFRLGLPECLRLSIFVWSLVHSNRREIVWIRESSSSFYRPELSQFSLPWRFLPILSFPIYPLWVCLAPPLPTSKPGYRHVYTFTEFSPDFTHLIFDLSLCCLVSSVFHIVTVDFPLFSNQAFREYIIPRFSTPPLFSFNQIILSHLVSLLDKNATYNFLWAWKSWKTFTWCEWSQVDSLTCKCFRGLWCLGSQIWWLFGSQNYLSYLIFDLQCSPSIIFLQSHTPTLKHFVTNSA